MVRLGADLLFSSGAARLKDSGAETLGRIAYIFENYPERIIRIVGHSDDLGISKWLRWRFPSNWELSSARAASAARFLIDEAGIDPARIHVVGRSHYEPVADNDTAEGRAENRRLEIQLLPPDYGRHVVD